MADPGKNFDVISSLPNGKPDYSTSAPDCPRLGFSLEPLSATDLAEVLELDQAALGGLWSEAGYLREIESPNSDLLILRQITHPPTTHPPTHPPTSQTQELGREARCADLPPDRPVLGLGCLWAILDEAHITTLAVHPNYQRQGLGQFLLCNLLQFAIKRHLAWATLEVRMSNESALRLYDKFGFQRVGQRKRYYQDNGEDALILWCKGLQTAEFAQRLHLLHTLSCDRLRQSGWSYQCEPCSEG